MYIRNIYIYIRRPLSLSQAGAAPGTTLGVQLWPQASLTSSSSQGHSPFNSTNSSGWHAHLFFRVFKATVCPPLKLLNL